MLALILACAVLANNMGDMDNHNHDMDNMNAVNCTSGNGDAMTCLHLGCCEWHTMMSMCVDASEPDHMSDPLNRCPEATDQMNCEHFAHAHECQDVTYSCVWDSDSSTCDRTNDCGTVQMEMHCAHFESDEYECEWSNDACIVARWLETNDSMTMTNHTTHDTMGGMTTEESTDFASICAQQSEMQCSHFAHTNPNAGFACTWNAQTSSCDLGDDSSSDHDGMGEMTTESPTSGNAAVCASETESQCAHYDHTNPSAGFECEWNSESGACELVSSSDDGEGSALSAADATCATNDGNQLDCEHYHHDNAVTFACIYNSDTGVCSSTSLSNGATMDHSMSMYFHTGMDEVLWFEDFKTDSNWKYTAACFAILGFGIVREFSVLYRRKIKKILNGRKRGNSVIGPDFSGTIKTHSASDVMYYSSLDTILVGTSMLASYMLMLAFMTYNTGFCIVTIGTFMLTNFYMHWVNEDPEIVEDCCAADVEEQNP